jgi:hypothetical protein
MIASLLTPKNGYWAVYDTSEYGWQELEPISPYYLTKAEADADALKIQAEMPSEVSSEDI